MSSQILLPFGKFDRFNFELYWAGPNQQAVTWLQQSITTKPGVNVYLWGEHGTGKSHLLQAACTLAATRDMQVIYIPLADRSQISPEMLNGIESLDMVCIDDVDAIAGESAWELAIFNLYNQLAAEHKPLLVSARTSPAGLPLQLADLKSRLTASVTWHIVTLEEKDRLLALQQRARVRGFELPDEVMDYLAKRVARDMHSLFSWLDRLDQATLISKKKLTVPFVRELLDQ
jgi:DnaA-homolog protein